MRLPRLSPQPSSGVVNEEGIDIDLLAERPDGALADSEAHASEKRASHEVSEAIHGEFGADSRWGSIGNSREVTEDLVKSARR